MRILLIFLIIIFHSQSIAQQLRNQTLSFDIKEGLNKEYSIEILKFYVSQLKFLKNGEIVFTENNSYHLIDVFKSNSFTLNIDKNIEYDQIQFLLGIDSLTNVSGALDGDLDPTKGMYWAWQSGYINFKLEGKHSDCPTRDSKFQFHLGGYLPPFLAAKIIVLNCTTSDSISIQFDHEAFLNEIDLKTTHTIMSPGQKAVELSSICTKHFKVLE